MWKPFNPNPFGLNTTDCTVRSICAVTGWTWNYTHKRLCDLARSMGEMPSRDRAWWELLRQIGFTQYELIDTCPNCYTVRDFARDHKYGEYVLGPYEHAVAVISGNWWDSWDSGGTVPAYFFRRE